jgi:hypothetical protein
MVVSGGSLCGGRCGEPQIFVGDDRDRAGAF